MDHYIDIKVLPDPEFSETMLMNAVFSKFHRTKGQANLNIGVSFKNMKKTLGDLLRLHGSKNDLEQLMSQGWLKGLSDFTLLSEISPVPQQVQYRTVSRKQDKRNVERIRRRAIKKGWVTESEAVEKINIKEKPLLPLPFLEIKSLSSDQRFRLFIDHGELKDEPSEGKFSSYGLSSSATIPWF